MVVHTLFHAAFCSAHLFGRCQIWSIWTFSGTFSDFRTFGLSDFRYAFHSSIGMCLSFRLTPASPALEGGKSPLTPPLHTQYLPLAKRYNWIFWFSGHPGSEMDSKSLKSHPKWPCIPCSMQHFAVRIFLVGVKFGRF